MPHLNKMFKNCWQRQLGQQGSVAGLSRGVGSACSPEPGSPGCSWGLLGNGSPAKVTLHDLGPEPPAAAFVGNSPLTAVRSPGDAEASCCEPQLPLPGVLLPSLWLKEDVSGGPNSEQSGVQSPLTGNAVPFPSKSWHELNRLDHKLPHISEMPAKI